jgi:hypothetical protein
MSSIVPPPYQDTTMAPKIELIASSFFRQARRPLVQKSDDVIAALWTAPCAILAEYQMSGATAHFANRCALEVYETDYLGFSAQVQSFPAQKDQQPSPNGLFSGIHLNGGIAKYSGDLLSCRGNRFRVQHALTWPLIDEDGACHGYAAMFDLWVALE